MNGMNKLRVARIVHSNTVPLTSPNSSLLAACIEHKVLQKEGEQ